ncbi:MAG: four helix bundle protein [Chloroflexi bacterium]|nr:four helix bundle protein [Chloroflexota bacterium]
MQTNKPYATIDLKTRTRAYALRIIRLYSALPKKTEAQILGKQLLRSGTAVGAQYRESQFAKSNKDFINKIEGALQELEESVYWIELLFDSNLTKEELLTDLLRETKELIAIFVTIVKKVKVRG